MQEQNYYIITVGEAKALEPLLKPTFNFSVEYTLADELCCTKTSMKQPSQWTGEEKRCAELCKDENGVRSGNKFGLMFDNDELYIRVPFSFPEPDIRQMLDNYISNKDADIKKAILLMSAILYRQQNDSLSEIEYMQSEYENYIYYVRPDMLKLYIAMHEKSRQGLDVRVSFGGSKPAKLDNVTSWIDVALSDYLHKYLGIDSIEEAQEELKLIYNKKSGRPEYSVEMSKYAWGLSRLLNDCTLLNHKGKTRFIMEYLKLVGLYEDKEIERDEKKKIKRITIIRSTTSDGLNRFKLRLKYLNTKFKTVDELYNSCSFKLSPNNPDPINWGQYY